MWICLVFESLSGMSAIGPAWCVAIWKSYCLCFWCYSACWYSSILLYLTWKSPGKTWFNQLWIVSSEKQCRKLSLLDWMLYRGLSSILRRHLIITLFAWSMLSMIQILFYLFFLACCRNLLKLLLNKPRKARYYSVFLTCWCIFITFMSDSCVIFTMEMLTYVQ